MKLIQNLPVTPMDIIGDVHGELEALEMLLEKLGYQESGYHPEGRKLVFLGDLVDRGPDSPGVLEKVIELVNSGHAQCVLGNHELNLLRDDPKPGNEWFVSPDQETEYPATKVTPEQKPVFERFLASLPLVLERSDLRIVHACWNAAAIDSAREIHESELGVIDFFDQNMQSISRQLERDGVVDRRDEETQRLAVDLKDKKTTPEYLPARAEYDAAWQMNNPVRVLTSGEEEPAGKPFWAGGKWRMVSRVPWWDHYVESAPVIIGHYWRKFGDAGKYMDDKHGPDIFVGIEPHHWMGKQCNVYCVDFSVGARYKERGKNTPPFQGQLSALRVPEWEVVHDTREGFDIGPPGRNC